MAYPVPVYAASKPRILLAACGSVAATNLGILFRGLSEWADVRAVITKAFMRFVDVTSLPLEIILYTDEEDWSTWRMKSGRVLHHELCQWADVMIIAPLSANTLGKIAGGLGDNLLTCIVLEWDYSKPFFVAPGMDTCMWTNPFTERHLKFIINELQVTLIPPISGVYGTGAMPEPSVIISTVKYVLEKKLREETVRCRRLMTSNP